MGVVYVENKFVVYNSLDSQRFTQVTRRPTREFLSNDTRVWFEIGGLLCGP